MTNVWHLFEYVAYAFATRKLRSATIESHLSAIKFFHRISRGFELDTSHPVIPSALKATALVKKVLGEFEAKRAATRNRKAEHSIVKSHQTFLRCKDNGERKEAADKTFLRFLLATGQSFSIGESPYFRDFVTAVSKVPGWTARERRTLAGTDIDEEYRKVDVESKARLERNGLQRGKTLQTDGMTTKSGVPLVNIIESIDGEERFLTAVDTTGHKKDMHYLLTLVEPNICADTDLLVTDGACGGLLTLVEQKHPRMAGMKCGAHAVDLLIKDCVKFPYLPTSSSASPRVVQFVKNHHGTSAIYGDKTELRLITPCATQFATNVMVAMRMLTASFWDINIESIPSTAASEELRQRPAHRRLHQDCNDEGSRRWARRTKRDQRRRRATGRVLVRGQLLRPADDPLYKLLRMGDGALPCMSKFLNGFMKIPERWDQVVELRQDVSKAMEGEGWKDPDVLARLPNMKDNAESRLEFVWSPIMSAAWILDPEYRSRDLTKNPRGGRMLTDTTTMFKRLLIDHGDDSEAAIAAAAELPNGGPVGKAGAQLGLFRTGKWAGAELLSFAKSMSPADWWQTYGLHLPELAQVVVRVTSKVPASAGAERNWSLYGDESDGSVGSEDESGDAIESGDGLDDNFEGADSQDFGVEI
eukprot:jgi/Undpi1/2533/HiC_scaffold_13.g05912.m1